MARDEEHYRYDHLCPIDRKTEAKHRHESNSLTHFYHEETLWGDTEAPGRLTLMFARVELADGRTLVQPLSLNVSQLGSHVSWVTGSPIDSEMLGSRLVAVLSQARMLLK